MKNKKAILFGNTLKIVLAVVVLVLLFGGAYKLYGAVTKDTELENAQNILNKIKAKIDALELNQNTILTIAGFDSSETWVIVGWSKNDISAPEKCFFLSCVCICSNGFHAENCKERGICRDLDTDKVFVEAFYNKVERINPGPLDPYETPQYIERDEKELRNYITLPANFVEIKIEKGINSEGTFVRIKNE